MCIVGPLLHSQLIFFFRYWNEKGIFSGRNTRIPDIDDTSMGFRLLRLHGYDVSAGKLSLELKKKNSLFLYKICQNLSLIFAPLQMCFSILRKAESSFAFLERLARLLLQHLTYIGLLRCNSLKRRYLKKPSSFQPDF